MSEMEILIAEIDSIFAGLEDFLAIEMPELSI